MELAKEHGNKLTQTINEKGELVGIENASTTEKTLGLNATMEDIKKELFEGDNIVKTDTDHGLSQLNLNRSNAKSDNDNDNDNVLESNEKN